jgi:hypothetical protein
MAQSLVSRSFPQGLNADTDESIAPLPIPFLEIIVILYALLHRGLSRSLLLSGTPTKTLNYETPHSAVFLQPPFNSSSYNQRPILAPFSKTHSGYILPFMRGTKLHTHKNNEHNNSFVQLQRFVFIQQT